MRVFIKINKCYIHEQIIDETLGQQVGLLLIELQICVRQVDKALSLITYFYNQVTNQTTLTQKEAKPKGNNDNEQSNKSNEELLQMLERYRIRCNLLLHSLKSASTDIKILSDDNGNVVEVLYLLANQQYLEGNFVGAMQTLGKVPAEALKYV